MSTHIERIQNIQQKVDNAQIEYNKLEGKEEQLMLQLKNDFGLNSIEEAQEKLDAMKKDIERREERLERVVSGLEDKIKQ